MWNREITRNISPLLECWSYYLETISPHYSQHWCDKWLILVQQPNNKLNPFLLWKKKEILGVTVDFYQMFTIQNNATLRKNTHQLQHFTVRQKQVTYLNYIIWKNNNKQNWQVKKHNLLLNSLIKVEPRGKTGQITPKNICGMLLLEDFKDCLWFENFKDCLWFKNFKDCLWFEDFKDCYLLYRDFKSLVDSSIAKIEDLC